MSAPSLQPGHVVGGDFVVERALSSGGMGAVYVCLQKSTGKRRALKVMLPALMEHASLRDRFVQEAKVGARIESDYIVDVVAAGLDPFPWLAMELLDGEDLGRHVERSGPLGFDAAKTVLEQACHAVGAAHAAGVVHRDLKPENIFLGRSRRLGTPYEVKILDFGIAKITDEATTKGGKNTSPIGSRPWMAPEQATVGATIGPPADVWALGLIAFFLLTGRHYWRTMVDPNANDMMLIVEVMSGVLDPASRRAEMLRVGALSVVLPDGFDHWFSRCVARDPSVRFRNAHEAYDGFAALAGRPSTDPRPSVSATSKPEALRIDTVVGTPVDAALADATVPTSVRLSTSSPISNVPSHVPRPSRRPLWIAAAALVVATPLAVFGVSRALRTPPSTTTSSANAARPMSSGTSSALPMPVAPWSPSDGCPSKGGDMVVIRGGTFSMGASDGEPTERPVHDVTVADFCLDATEVTARAYDECVKSGHCTRVERTFGECNEGKASREDHPINCVSWTDADAFCTWAEKKLPTEEQWEYAARGGREQRRYPWGAALPSADVLNACGTECKFKEMFHASDGFPTTAPVGRFSRGDAKGGVHDLGGNVAEWTSSFDSFGYDGERSATNRVVRGGSWLDADVASVRGAARKGNSPSNTSDVVGFRCAR